MRWSPKTDPTTGEAYIGVDTTGRPLLLDPLLNKGMAFDPAERDTLKLHGLVPPAVNTLEQQLDRTYENFRAKSNDLEKYIYLASLQDRNETLFFRLALEHINEMMPIVYTPVVGLACQRFSHIWRRARGLYISYEQRDRIPEILAQVPFPPAVIVATDGERILGLGDQGAGGMGIPIGKLCLYTLCAGLPPQLTLPIMLDVGTDNEERLADPLYLGLRQRRLRGKPYQEFIDRFVAAVAQTYPEALLQWEDLLKENAIDQLNRFRDRVCSFNDDIQGTAGVVVAGIMGALRITGQPLTDQRVLFAGAGASTHGISHLIMAAMVEEGLTPEEARRRIWMVDSRGLVTEERKGLEDFKAVCARSVSEISSYTCEDRSRITLEEAVKNARPTILLGTSGTPGVFTESIVSAMADFNERPIIFPLSNPTSKSECVPEDAIRWSNGRAILATGSPFDPVTFKGRHYRIGQGNNAFLFPGVGLGVWVGRIRRVTDRMFLQAARALAAKVEPQDLATTSVYPDLRKIRECSHAVACAVIRCAVEEGMAEKEALDRLEEKVAKAMWQPAYRPLRFEGPER